MKSKLEEIKSRCEAATKGEWTHGYKDGSGKVGEDDEGGHILGGNYQYLIVRGGREDYLKYGVLAEKDAEFIAHARQDLPWAVGKLEEARGLFNKVLERGVCAIYPRRKLEPEIRKFLEEK